MGIKLPEGSADMSKNRTLRLVVVAVNAVTLLLGFVLLIAAAAAAIKSDANGQLLAFTAFLGLAFFGISALGICGVTKYDSFLYLYFVVTLFIAITTLFITVYVLVNQDKLKNDFKSTIQENWGDYYDALGSDLQGQISKVFEDMGCAEVSETVDDDVVTSTTECVTWYEECVEDVDTLSDECYQEVEDLISSNVTVVSLCLVGLVLLSIAPLVITVKIMGFHEIVKHSQLITTICLTVVAFAVTVGAGLAAGYVTRYGLATTATVIYVVLVFALFLFITCIVNLIGSIKNITALQFVSSILYGILALIFLILFIVCFAYQDTAATYMARDCNEQCDCESGTCDEYDCFKTPGEDYTCFEPECTAVRTCVEYVYWSSYNELVTHLEEENAECDQIASDAEAADNWWDNNLVDIENEYGEACGAYANAMQAAESFFAGNYDNFQENMLSYLTQTGYTCAFTFLFCVIQVGASYYISKTSSELQE